MNRDTFLDFYNRLGRTRTKYTECIKITRKDGVVFRFTALDKDLEIQETPGNSYVYKAAKSFRLTALENQAGLVVSNMDVQAIVDDETISENDLYAGLYDTANLELFIAYWSATEIGLLPLRTSWIGEITMQGVSFKADLRGIAQKLAQTFINTTSLECRFTFGGVKCAVGLAPYTKTVTITAVESNDVFHSTINPADYNKFQWGLATWTTGKNKGYSMEVIRNTGARIQLFLPMTRPVEVGDSLSLIYGCDKRYKTCRDVYNNATRFGGEPFLTGSDLIVSYPQSVGTIDDNATIEQADGQYPTGSL